MPGSARENGADVRAFVAAHPISTALDVGPGRGTYYDLLADLVPTIDAIEVWYRYIRKYDLRAKYHEVKHADVRCHRNFAYDLVIFGDVLEHMSAEESAAVWARARAQARYGLISVPLGHYPQGEVKGNPFEVHRQDHLTVSGIRTTYGPFVCERLYRVTGLFIAAFAG